MHTYFLSFAFLLLFPLLTWSQSTNGGGDDIDFSAKQHVQHFVASLEASTNGMGIGFRYARGRRFRFEGGMHLFSLKHPKELRVKSVFLQQGSKFIYDKINRFYVLNPTFGVHTDLIPASHPGPIHVNLGLGVGPAFGLLRPYFLEVAVPVSGNPGLATIEVEQYDPSRHFFTDIVGSAGAFEGNGNLTLMPGVGIRAYTWIDFGQRISAIRAIEVGGSLNVFFKEVDIMGDTPDKKSFLTLSIGFVMGSRWQAQTK